MRRIDLSDDLTLVLWANKLHAAVDGIDTPCFTLFRYIELDESFVAESGIWRQRLIVNWDSFDTAIGFQLWEEHWHIHEQLPSD